MHIVCVCVLLYKCKMVSLFDNDMIWLHPLKPTTTTTKAIELFFGRFLSFHFYFLMLNVTVSFRQSEITSKNRIFWMLACTHMYTNIPEMVSTVDRPYFNFQYDWVKSSVLMSINGNDMHTFIYIHKYKCRERVTIAGENSQVSS